MSPSHQARPDLRDTLRSLLHPRVVTMLFLGFSAGLPLLLIFSTLSLWLREAGLDRAAVTFFSWAALAYSFKFVWAPVVSRVPVPLLGPRLGQRRAWLLLAQGLICLAIVTMAATDPAQGAGLTHMALAAVLLGFSSATQDIVIDAYRIESDPGGLQPLMSSAYMAGYRLGMLSAGAGALLLAAYLGTRRGAYHYQAWHLTYLVMAGAMSVGLITTLLIPEPTVRSDHPDRPTGDYLGFLGVLLGAAAAFVGGFLLGGTGLARLWPADAGPLLGFLREALQLAGALAAAWLAARLLVALGLVRRATLEETHIAPVREFFHRYRPRTAWLLLALVGVYRISDIVLGVIANVFYQDLGFTKGEIAGIVNSYGLVMAMLGAFLGGPLAQRHGVIRILFIGALLSSATNLLFILLAERGHDLLTLYLVISADNLSAGLASAAFVAFLSSLTNVSFTAVQYAIFSSLMTLLPKLLGGYSGTLVGALGYPKFFLFTTLLGLPVLLLVHRAQGLLAPQEGQPMRT
jgi:MFS transporter, PAT family, beta-lactamase induction signal transducer AmpG